ncbi:uncharacterized protein LOC125680196 [Ostrea edulis]|uniref:uncharacterized protein LOC125680196 n=1 Tax=Ostrea edulis TaxID=37623 RepID=UPI0024AF0FB8|nr:uncharacterized protein LOC125680196 [Ostrea edulis]
MNSHIAIQPVQKSPMNFGWKVKDSVRSHHMNDPPENEKKIYKAYVVQNNIERMMKKITSFVFLRILFEVVPTSSFSSAKYVWPLTDSTYTYEVKTSKNGDYSQCGFHFAGDHPSFSRDPLQLNGHNYPYIDIDIDDGNEFKSFSFALSVNISGSNGCIFHFKSTTTSSTDITDVSVCLSGGTLTMEVASSLGTSNAIFVPSQVQGQWIIVQAGRNFDNRKLKFIVDNFIDEVSDTHNSKILGLPGTLRIGARHDTTMALSLRVTCITMYDVTTNTGSEVYEIENQCKTSPSVSGIPASPSPGCDVLDTTTQPYPISSSVEPLSTTFMHSTSVDTQFSQCTRIDIPNQHYGSFIRTVKDTIFNDPTSLIEIAIAFSKRKCAEMCVRNYQCLSFLYRNIHSGSSICSMYKTFTPSNPAPQLNSHLYILNCM